MRKKYVKKKNVVVRKSQKKVLFFRKTQESNVFLRFYLSVYHYRIGLAYYLVLDLIKQ
jgi:hypothetical protein